MRSSRLWLAGLGVAAGAVGLALALPHRFPSFAPTATQVYSIRSAVGAERIAAAEARIAGIRGVRGTAFDPAAVELTVTQDRRQSDAGVLAAGVLAALVQEGLDPVVGAGHGSYLAYAPYPAGADVAVLSPDGSPVGSLAKLRVPGKFTVFDVYADWCGPCRAVDAQLRSIMASRSDVAVRRLNLVRFDSPLAREFGAHLTGLPHVVVYAPDGTRTEIHGADPKKLDAALAPP